MIAASSAEASAAVDCTVPCAGKVVLGSAGIGSSGVTGSVKVDPAAPCVPVGGVGWIGCGTGCVPLGNIDGVDPVNCAQVCGVQGSLLMNSSFAYPANVDLDSLECVRSSLSLINTDIVNFSADVLTTLGDDFWVQSNSALLSTSADVLVATGEPSAAIPPVPGTADIVFKSNPTLAFALFPSLDTVRGRLEFSFNAALPNLAGFPLLTTVEQGLTIASNAALDLIAGEFPILDWVWGTLSVTGNKAMTTFSVPTLTMVGPTPPIPAPQGVLINANKLTTLDLSGLAVLRSGFTLSAEPNLTAAGIVAMPALAAVPTSLVISTNGSLANLGAFAAVTTIGTDLVIDNNDSLINITGISSVAAIGRDLTLRGNDILPAATFPAIAALRDLEIRSNLALVTLGFPALAALGLRLYVFGNASLPDIGGAGTVGFPVLAAIGTTLHLHNNDAMTTVTMPALTTVVTEVYAKFNDVLATITLPVIDQIGSTPLPPLIDGAVSIASNPALVGWFPNPFPLRPPRTATASANGAGFCAPFTAWAAGNAVITVVCTP